MQAMATEAQEKNVSTTQKTVATAANPANLLPTGTVLAFGTLIPSFSHNGSCHLANKGLTASAILVCAVICFFSSFTDSFTDAEDRKFYYGIATRKGIHLFNPRKKEMSSDEKTKYKIKGTDYFHAFLSLTVLLIYSMTDLHVKDCFFSNAGDNLDQLIINLPLGAAILASFLFTIFPTTRRGIGYTDRGNKNASTVTAPAVKESEVVEILGVAVEGGGAQPQASTTT